MRSRHGAADYQQTAARRARLRKMSVDDGAQRLLIITGEVLAAAALVMTMVWFLHFDTGLDWSNADCAGKPCVFNYHPILMVAGFGLLGFNGLVSWRIIPTSVDRNTRKAIHLGVQAAAYALAIVGVRAVFKFHNEHVPAIANMYSLHSWLGIVVMILWGLQLAAGLYHFVSGTVPVEKRQSYMPLHVFFGVAIACLALVVMLIGIQEKLAFYQGDKAYATKPAVAMHGNVLGLVLGALFVVTILVGASLARPNKFDRASAYEQLE